MTDVELYRTVTAFREALREQMRKALAQGEGEGWELDVVAAAFMAAHAELACHRARAELTEAA